MPNGTPLKRTAGDAFGTGSEPKMIPERNHWSSNKIPAKSRKGQCVVAFKKGWASVAKVNRKKEDSGSDNKFHPFQSGDTLLVKLKSENDVIQYYGYGIFEQVHTFIPEKPSERNEDGFVESNPTPWDLASQYHYELRKTDETNADYHKEMGYRYAGKARFMIGFYNVETGEDIVVDFTARQAGVLLETLAEYAEVDEDGNIIEGESHDFLDMVFKLSKRGKTAQTTVTLSPIVNMKKGLTDEQRQNAESEAAQTPFDEKRFDDMLYVMKEDEQIRELVKDDFDVTVIGLEIPKLKKDDETGESDEDPTEDF